MIEVLINNEMEFDVPIESLQNVVRTIVADHGYNDSEISLAVIDSESMHRLNREHLQHDYPTDVLSFVLEDEETLEGEVIVSADMVKTVAPEYNWPATSEMLLYFIHGTLHLVGYDDHDPVERQKMREKESHYLRLIEIEPPSDHAARTLKNKE